MKKLPSILFLMSACALYAQENTPATLMTSGNWSDPTTWGFTSGTMATTAGTVVLNESDLVLNADVDATITSLKVSKNKKFTFTAGAGKTLTINGCSYETSGGFSANFGDADHKSGTFNVAPTSTFQNATINANGGVLNFKSLSVFGGAMYIRNGAAVHLKQSFTGASTDTYNASGSKTYINNGSLYGGTMVFGMLHLEKDGAFTSTNGTRILTTDSYLKGAANVSGITTSSSVVGDDGVTYYTRHFSMRFGNGTNSSYEADAARKMTIYDGATINQRKGSATVDPINDILVNLDVQAAESALKFENSLHLAGNGILNLNSKNAFAQQDSSGNIVATQGEMTLNLSRHYNDSSVSSKVWAGDVAINLGADNDWGSFLFGSNVNLDLTLNGHNLSVGLIASQAASNDAFTLTLMDLADLDDNFKVNMSKDAIVALDIRDSSGKKLVEGVDYFVADAGNGWSYINAQIPEPSEWAAIFGAFALGLVVYRKRK